MGQWDSGQWWKPQNDPVEELLNSIGNYNTRLGAIGMEPPAPKDDTNWFFKMLEFIDRPRDAIVSGIGSVQDGGTFGEGFMGGLKGDMNTDMSTILERAGIENPILKYGLGFIGDVALDPTTYLTLGAGSFAKGLATGAAKNLTSEAAQKLAKDELVDLLGGAVSKVAKTSGMDTALFGGMTKVDDAVKALNTLNANPNAMNLLGESLKGGRLTGLLDAFKASGDDVAKGVSSHFDEVSKSYGDELFKQYNKIGTKGFGVELPFTNKGVELIGGDKFQAAGAAVANKLRNAPVIGKPVGAMQDASKAIFDKYGIDASDTVKQYLRQKDIVKQGMIDLSNANEMEFLKQVSQGKELGKYSSELDNIVSLAEKDTDLAKEYIAKMDDSPFKQWILSVGHFQGSPLNNVDWKEYGKGLTKNVYTLVDEDELEDFYSKGISAFKKGASGEQTLRYFGKSQEEAKAEALKQGKKMYILSVDNLQSKTTSQLDSLKQALEGNPEYTTTSKIARTSNTNDIFEVNPEGKTPEEILRSVKDDTNEVLKDRELDGEIRWLKPTESQFNPSAVKNYIKVKDGNTFVPKLKEDGSVDKAVWQVFREGRLIDEVTEESVAKYGFKDMEEFNNLKPTKEFNLDGIKEMHSELTKGVDDARWNAMTELLENPEKLYSSTLTTEDKALRSVGIMLMDRLREAGMKEKNLGYLSSLMDDYVPHVMSWEKTKEVGKNWGGGMTKELGNVNLNSLPREYKVSVKEVNEIMKAKGFGDNYFETNMAKAYLTRMQRHNKVMFDGQFVERLLGGVGFDVTKFSDKAVADTVKSLGGKMADYTMVIPKAYLRVFSIAGSEAGTLEAMIDFMKNGQEFTSQAKNLRTVGGSVKSIVNDLENIKSSLGEFKGMDEMLSWFFENNTAAVDQMVENMVKKLGPMEKVNPEDLKTIQKLAETMKKMPDGAIQKFRDTFGLRSKLKNLLDMKTGALGEIDKETFDMLAAHQKDLKAFIVPKSVYKYVTKQSAGQFDEGMQAIGKMIDSFNGFWKTSVTSLIPSFHLRNFFGGQQQNAFEFGVKVFSPKFQKAGMMMAAGKDGNVTLNGVKYTYKELKDLMIKYRVDTPFIRTAVKDQSDMYIKELSQGIEGGGFLKGTKPWQLPSKAGRVVGNAVEQDVRAVNFMAWLDEGLDPLTAAERTKQAHFDYTELSSAERNVFKRIMPFYTFFRKNFPYQIQHFLNEPGDVTKLKHLVDNGANAMGFDEENRPDWLEKSFAMPLKKGEDGRDYYANLSLPVGDVAGRTPRELAAGLNPALVTLMEQLFNANILTGAPIERYPGQSTDMFGAEVPNRLMHVLNKFGVARNSVDTLRNISSDSSDSLLTSGNAFNPATGFGMVRGYSPEKGKVNSLYDRERELENLLQELKADGIKVPTINELKKINPRINSTSSRITDRGYLGF